MHKELKEAESALGLAGHLQHLDAAHDRSEAFIRAASEALRDAASRQLESPTPLDDLPLDVVAFGSYARYEATDESDFDYLVITHGLPGNPKLTRALLREADNLRKLPQLRANERNNILFQQPARSAPEIRPPGLTGMFGRVVAAPDLTERIGLEQDTNQSHTVRMLLLQECVSLFQPNRLEALLRTMLQRYLIDYREPKKGVPRFLLNDTVRYWRTLTVDYQAKRYEQLVPKWGLRYLKLIISRKLAFAGTLASLLLCDEIRPATVDYLYGQVSMPPLARLAQLHRYISEEAPRQSLGHLLLYADSFNERLGDGAFREEVEAVEDLTSDSPAFKDGREMARKVQQHLEVLFFESDILGYRTRRYLSF